MPVSDGESGSVDELESALDNQGVDVVEMLVCPGQPYGMPLGGSW